MSDAYPSPSDPSPPVVPDAWSLESLSRSADPLYSASLAVAEAKTAGRGAAGGGLWLIITLVLFMLSLAGGFDWTKIAMIVVVLLIHEAGHYLGMLWFGYRDVRMFFIPFFGAAVSGRKHGAPAWQQIIVLFLGPLPGMVVALVLYAALQPPLESPLGAFVFWLMAINAFNLLPFVPLDGGRILNLLLFRRHPLLESTFQCFAVLSMGGLALVLQSIVLGVFAGLMTLTITARYRLTKLAGAVRAAQPNLAAPLAELDEQERYALFQHAQSLSPSAQNPQMIGGQMFALHETIAEQSPKWLASLGFLFAYGTSLMLVIAFVALVGMNSYREGMAQRELIAAEISQLCDTAGDLLADARRLEAQRPSNVGVEGDALKLRLQAAEQLKVAKEKLERSQPPLEGTAPGFAVAQQIELLEGQLWDKVPAEGPRD
jgi:Zn-dependent protease